MSQKQDNLIVALDLGSAWTRVLAAEVVDGSLRYRAHGIAPSAGMRKGLIADLAPAARAVRAANERAEKIAGCDLAECIIGVGGPHIFGLNNKGGFTLGSRMREITAEDVRTAVECARTIERPADREFLHLLPRHFILDGQPGISDPVGMIGARLEVDLHIATCSGSALQSTVTCANRAGLEVTEAVFESIAVAEGTLSADERELGVCLLDIGAHSSDLVVFVEGAVTYTASIPIGGTHFTSDLAIGLQMPVANAEELKIHYGNAVVTAVRQDAEIEISNPEPQRLSLREMAEILQPRARQLFHYVRESLRQGQVLDLLGTGCVLTGGGSLLRGMLDVASSMLQVDTRSANPVRLSNIPAELANPSFATAIGMLLYAQRTRKQRAEENKSLRARLRAAFAPGN